MQVRTTRDIGLLIRDRRQARGLDQATLAAKAGVSRQWIVGVERGRPRAEVGLILRTLRVLGIELRVAPSRTESPADRYRPGSVDIDAVLDRVRENRGKE